MFRLHKFPLPDRSLMLRHHNSPPPQSPILRCHKSPFSSLAQSLMFRLHKFPLPDRSLMLRHHNSPARCLILLRRQKFPPSGFPPNSPPSPRFLPRKLSHLPLVVSPCDPLPPPSFS